MGLDCRIRFDKRLPNFSGPSELKAAHPLGKAPVLTDGGQGIAESAVILQHLQESYDAAGLLKPADASARQQYRYWMHYAEASLMPLLVMQLVMNNVPQHAPWLIRPVARKISAGVKAGFVQPRLKDHIEFLEGYLAEHDYFAGQFSFADIQMSFPLQALQLRSPGKYPYIQAFLQRISSRPAFQQALRKEQALER